MALAPVQRDSDSPMAAPRPDGEFRSGPGPAAAPQGTPEPDKRKGPPAAVRIIGLVALLAAAIFGVNWFLNGRYQISTDNAHVRADITAVASRVTGYVKSVHVTDNQVVNAGDLLVTLESEDNSARVDELNAALAQAQADAAQSAARVAAQRDQLAEAQAGSEAAAAAADLSASDAKRLADLADKGWYPKARLEQAQAQDRTATAQRAQADAGVTSQRSQLSSAFAALTSAQAKVDAARAKLDAAQLDVDRSELRAPISGVVANRQVSPGQLLSPGQVAMSIVPANEAYVIANYKETQVSRMHPGQRVTLKVDAYPDLEVTGVVESIAPATGSTFSLLPQDTATGNFTKIVQRVPVRIKIDKASLETGLLRSGLMVTAVVSTKDAG